MSSSGTVFGGTLGPDLLLDCSCPVFPLINASILDVINLSLSTGYVPQAFKADVIKPLLKKAGLHLRALDNYRPISNLPLITKILEKCILN